MQDIPAPAEAQQEQTAASNESAAPAKATGDQPENQPAKAASAKKTSGTKTVKADNNTITIKVGTLSKVFKDPFFELNPLPNNEVPYTIEGADEEQRALLVEIISFKHGESSTNGNAKYPNAGTYSLSVEDPESLEASLGCPVNCIQGTFVITPMPVTVTIIGKNTTARYDGKVHHAGGFSIESSYSGYTRKKVELKPKYSKQANVNRRKPGKKMMGLKVSMFRNTDPNYDVTFKKVIDGYAKVYPKDGPVPEPEKDSNSGSNGSSNSSNNGNGSSNGSSNNGYTGSSNGGNGGNGGYYDANGNYVPYDNNGNGSNSGNGTSEQASGQNGDNNGGTEAIDDNDTPKTDGSGTETIDDNDTPKTDGDEADDGSDTMPSMLPIILIILAIIAAFLLLLFSRRKRDDEQ